MSQEYDPTKVVILHSGGVDPTILPQQLGITLPISVLSFTDTYPNAQNQHNQDLSQAAFDADHLLIEESVFRNMTKDYKEATHSQGLSSRPHTARIFRPGGGVHILTAAGYDKEALEAEVTTGMEAVKE